MHLNRETNSCKSCFSNEANLIYFSTELDSTFYLTPTWTGQTWQWEVIIFLGFTRRVASNMGAKMCSLFVLQYCPFTLKNAGCEVICVRRLQFAVRRGLFALICWTQNFRLSGISSAPNIKGCSQKTQRSFVWRFSCLLVLKIALWI